MRPAGREILELWREAGEWWAGDSSREVTRYVENGVRRAEEVELPDESFVATSTTEDEDFTEEIALQKEARKHRDTWSEYSKKGAEGFYESYKAKDVRR